MEGTLGPLFPQPLHNWYALPSAPLRSGPYSLPCMVVLSPSFLIFLPSSVPLPANPQVLPLFHAQSLAAGNFIFQSKSTESRDPQHLKADSRNMGDSINIIQVLTHIHKFLTSKFSLQFQSVMNPPNSWDLQNAALSPQGKDWVVIIHTLTFSII